MTTHKITKGFDLRLAGAPELSLSDASEPAQVAVETAEFAGIKPKVLVKVGDKVATGQPVFLDKLDRDVVFCSPTTGTVKDIVYGARRHLERVVIDNALASGGSEEFAELPRAGVKTRNARLGGAVLTGWHGCEVASHREALFESWHQFGEHKKFWK